MRTTTTRASSSKRNGRRGSKTPETLRILAPGTTLGELSRKSGIAAPHLSRIVNGKRRLTVDTAQRIAQAVGATIDAVAGAFPDRPQLRTVPAQIRKGERCEGKNGKCTVRHNPKGTYSEKLHRHHPDANEPSKTMRLCPACHLAEHDNNFANTNEDGANGNGQVLAV